MLELKFAEIAHLIDTCYLGQLPEGFSIYDVREMEQAYYSLVRHNSAYVLSSVVKDVFHRNGFHITVLQNGCYEIS